MLHNGLFKECKRRAPDMAAASGGCHRTAFRAAIAAAVLLLSSCATAQEAASPAASNDKTAATDNAPAAVALSDARLAVVAEVQKHLGAPYRRGGMGPKSFDCSGLVYFVAREAVKMQLPRTSQAMKDHSQVISEGDLLPGDLLFFKTVAPGKVSHVGIYIGEGRFVHAASDGPKTGVIVSSIMDKYWKAHYDCAGRIITE